MILSLIPPTNPILWATAAQVTDIPNQVLPHIPDMMALMEEHQALGLAAPQVGISFAFFLMRLQTGDIMIVINPKVLELNGWNISKSEGCLSFPGRTTFVPRKSIVKAEWISEKGVEMGNVFCTSEARTFLHELDHLSGVCIYPRPLSMQDADAKYVA